jgi:hypothetical protein
MGALQNDRDGLGRMQSNQPFDSVRLTCGTGADVAVDGYGIRKRGV